MRLREYFDRDDGSRPEIELAFAEPAALLRAFQLLFEAGARDVTVGGARLWLADAQTEQPFRGPGDVALVVDDQADAFHVMLAGIRIDGIVLPDLGVHVDPDRLTFDYRRGPPWSALQVDALLVLLVRLQALGGVVEVPWWGAHGEDAFRAALAETARSQDIPAFEPGTRPAGPPR